MNASNYCSRNKITETDHKKVLSAAIKSVKTAECKFKKPTSSLIFCIGLMQISPAKYANILYPYQSILRAKKDFINKLNRKGFHYISSRREESVRVEEHSTAITFICVICFLKNVDNIKIFQKD